MEPSVTCALCRTADSDNITGTLQRAPDGSVVAHYNCMLYSPKTIAVNSQEALKGFDFDIQSVLSEIERGQNLRCNHCKKSGATVGCDVDTCRRSYHYPCVKKAKGSPKKNTWLVYCAWHKKEKTGEVPKASGGQTKTKRRKKRKGWQKPPGRSRRNIVKRLCDNADTQNMQINEISDQSFNIPIHSVIELEENEEAGPSTSGQNCHFTSSATSGGNSEESDSILSPKVNSCFSLSGLSKKKNGSSNRKPNEKLEEVLKIASSQEKDILYQMYSDLGGSQKTAALDNENDKITPKDALNSVVSETSTCSTNSEMDKTPERQPDVTVHVSPSGSSTAEKAFTGEQPEGSQDESMPNQKSDRVSKKEKKTLNNVISKLAIKGIRTLDAPSYSTNSIDIPDLQSPACSNSTIRSMMPSINSMAGNGGVTHSLSLSDDINLPTQQIPSTNSKRKLAPEPIKCTDNFTSIRPETLVGCSFFDVQPDKDLGAQGTSEMHPIGYPSVTEPGATLCSPLPLEEDGNETDDSTIVSDSSLVKMESYCDREIPSPSNGGILQNEKKGHNEGKISHVVSPQQITAISRKLGCLSEHLKNIVPQIKSNIESPKRNTTKDAEQSRDGQATSEGSPNSNTEDQTAGNDLHKPLEDCESSVHPIKEKDLVCRERSKSIARKRKLVQERLPNMRLQQTEGTVPESMEMPEEQGEYNLREKSLLEEGATPGPVKSEHASEHQSGPSRISKTLRRRLFGSHCRSKSRSGFQYERVADDIDGFGQAVAGQCRRIPQDRQARYMSYVLASADLFCARPTLPELDILITNLKAVLESSQPSTFGSACGSSG